MSLLIKNGEIVTASERYVADIFCENETITRIDRNIAAPKGAEVIDAKGKFVFPGFIDPHVHIYLPFMGTFAKDTYETASKAALVGGTTTLIEMCCPPRADDTLEGFEFWMKNAVGKSACDFTFHMGVTKFDDKTEKQLARNRQTRHQFVQSFSRLQRRVRRGRHGTLSHAQTREGTWRHRHRALRKRDAHRRTRKELLAAGKTDSGQHHESRPPQVEAEGVQSFDEFCRTDRRGDFTSCI